MYSAYSVPKSVDCGYGERHDGGQRAHDENGDAHHPQNLGLGGLEKKDNMLMMD